MGPTSSSPPWDGPFPPSRRIAGNGLRARSTRGAFATTWWGRRFVDAMEEVAGAGRVQRGRTYARAGQVLDLDVGPGRVRSQVQGSRPTPYSTSLTFSTWDAETRTDLAEAVADAPAVLAAVLGGVMPEDFEQLTLGAGLALFPESLADARFDCSCPDYGDPCKHAAAVVYLLAEWLDTEPFGVLTLRGVDRASLLAQVSALQRAPGEGSRSSPGVAPREERPLADSLTGFWTSRGPLPPLPATPPAGGTVLDELDATLLGLAGTPAGERLRTLYASLRATSLDDA